MILSPRGADRSPSQCLKELQVLHADPNRSSSSLRRHQGSWYTVATEQSQRLSSLSFWAVQPSELGVTLSAWESWVKPTSRCSAQNSLSPQPECLIECIQ